MPETPLYFRSAAELGRLIRARKVTSVQLTELYLSRLQTVGRKLNAVANLGPEQALAAARKADQEIEAGRSRSPLHGVPFGVKDLYATDYLPTTWGSPAHKDQHFDYNATAVQRLMDAGAVLLGKLAMVELAGGGGYDIAGASLQGPALCPWDDTRWAGGSSSGSGAAVGAGSVGFALGTETWGSITVPAAFCGITGLRPTYGRVSRHGAMALSWTCDKLGPMARSAEDCGYILDIIAGPDPLDDTSLPYRFNFRNGGSRSRKMRLGLLPQDFAKVPEVKAAFDAAVAALKKDTQLQINEAHYPPGFPYDEVANAIITAEGSAAFENLIRSDRLALLADPSQQSGLVAGLSVPAADYLRALRIRRMAVSALNEMWKAYDALIAPTLLTVAPLASKKLSENTEPWGGNGGPGNLAGWPSISVPMGFGKGHLPLGLEIIGPPLGEQTILDLAMFFQRRTGWTDEHPPL